MLKFFTNNTYSKQDLEALKKEKKALSMKLHPDHGGDSKDFIQMMEEFSKIENSIKENEIFENNVKEVKVRFENSNENAYKSEKKSQDEMVDEVKDFVDNLEFDSIINYIIPKKYINVKLNEIIFKKEVFVAFILSFILLGSIHWSFLIAAIILSSLSKSIKNILLTLIASFIIILFFQASILASMLDIISYKSLDIIVYLVMFIPIIFIAKVYYVNLNE